MPAGRFAPPAPAQVLLQHEQALRAVGVLMRDHTRALLAGQRQLWTLAALAERWGDLDLDQVRALVREHAGERAAAAGRVPIEDVLRIDQILKDGVAR